MTSKCIKLRICTLSCCSETRCLNYKYNIKVDGKINTNEQRDLENQGEPGHFLDILLCEL